MQADPDRSFVTSSDSAVPCSLSEAQSGNGYCRHGGQANVIGHCAHLDVDIGGNVGGSGGLLHNTGEGEGCSCLWRGKVGAGLPRFCVSLDFLGPFSS